MARDEDVIPLDDEPLPVDATASPAGPSRIQAFGQSAQLGRGTTKLVRPLNLTGAGATRCRIFHSKITVAAMEHLTNQINEWLDSEKAEVKCVTQVVGVLEGKTPEPNLIAMVWY